MVASAALPAPALRVPVQARALRTRAALLAAAERELSERGHQATTAQSIAARAGVATGSFYQYFVDKDAALRELADSRLRALEVRLLSLGPLRPAQLPRDPRRPLLAILDAVLDYHREDRGLHAVLTERRHVDPELDQLTHAAEQRLVQHLTELLSALGVRGDVQARAFVVYGLVEGCVHAHVLATPMLSNERLRQSLCDAVLAVAFAPSASTAKRTRNSARSKKSAVKR